ncbi:tRNA (guanine-N1)-methyltransferase [SAR116 cluster alpha proteobacterium HIMB100]|nr:tRNA (guanine-N1)-methyltransferase [SAR116 cluster alpha proteobacterium HIMB100]
MTDFTTDTSWTADILTLFPDMFPGTLGQSIAGRALKDGLWNLNVHNIRDFAQDKHNTVDDPPLGGGHGMVMRPDVTGAALDHVVNAYTDANRPPLLYPSPRGRQLDQAYVRELAAGTGVVMLCGRYEGLDQRVIDHYQLIEVSIGDYILSGGEQAAIVILDAVVRLLPGVMGKQLSHQQESFETGLLEHDHYTQPRDWRGQDVPPVLLSGHHQQIEIWRQQNAEMKTKQRRPDLWNSFCAKNRSKLGDKD